MSAAARKRISEMMKKKRWGGALADNGNPSASI